MQGTQELDIISTQSECYSFSWLGFHVTKQLWLWVTSQGRAVETFAHLTDILTHGAHGLTWMACASNACLSNIAGSSARDRIHKPELARPMCYEPNYLDFFFTWLQKQQQDVTWSTYCHLKSNIPGLLSIPESIEHSVFSTHTAIHC